MQSRTIYLDINFRGRMGRRPFWMSFLLLLALTLAGISVGVVLHNLGDMHNMQLLRHSGMGAMIVSVLWYTVTMLGLGARRLHDTGKSAWWLLLLLANVISGVGYLILFILWAMAPQPGENRWGSGS